MKVNNGTLAIGAVTLLGILALVAWLTYAGKDVTQLVTLVVTLLTTITGAVATYRKASQATRKVDDVAAAVSDVGRKVNGNLTSLIEKAASNGHDVTEHVAIMNDAHAAIAQAAARP